MKKHVFVLVRYSVLTQYNGAWVIGRDNDFESYKAALFDPQRLKLHTALFKSITLPSLLKMNKEKTTVLVFVSSEMPKKYLDAIKEVSLRYSHIKVVEVGVSQSLPKIMHNKLALELDGLGDDVCYASVRLDDDDALADDFYPALFKYVEPSFVGHSISFAKGYAGLYENGRYTNFYAQVYPKLALGLAHIHLYRQGQALEVPSIYALGGHTKIDERAPVIVDSRNSMYIRTIHEASDMFSSNIRSRVALEKNKVEASKVAKEFSFLGSDGSLSQNFFYDSPLVKSHHDTYLCFCEKRLIVLHCDFKEIIDNPSLHIIFYDKKLARLHVDGRGGWLDIDGKGAAQLVSEPEIKVLLSADNELVLKIKAVDVQASSFLSASRSGTVRAVQHCKAWEKFRLDIWF